MSIIMTTVLKYKIVKLQKRVYTVQSIQGIHLWKNQRVSDKFNTEILH